MMFRRYAILSTLFALVLLLTGANQILAGEQPDELKLEINEQINRETMEDTTDNIESTKELFDIHEIKDDEDNIELDLHLESVDEETFEGQGDGELNVGGEEVKIEPEGHLSTMDDYGYQEILDGHLSLELEVDDRHLEATVIVTYNIDKDHGYLTALHT